MVVMRPPKTSPSARPETLVVCTVKGGEKVDHCGGELPKGCPQGPPSVDSG